MVNTHVTAPGAIVALGLLFLKTNDRYSHKRLGSVEQRECVCVCAYVCVCMCVCVHVCVC